MLNSKKGTEMSVTVLVGIILGIAMLAAAMLLFFKIMVETDNSSEQIDEQMRAKIIQAIDSGDPVYVPFTNVDAKKGSATFPVGIKNIDSELKYFNMKVTLLDPETAPSTFDKVNGIQFLPGPYNISAKDNHMPLVTVNMKGVTEKVTLLVNVTVQNVPGGDYVQYQKPKIVYIEP